MISKAVIKWIEDHSYGEITNTTPVAGGCINNGVRLQTTSGTSFFLKTNSSAPPDMFAREVEGLDALRKEEGPRIPKAFLHGEDFLLLEDLAPKGRAKDYWPVFGRKFAALHHHTNEKFGFDHDNYLGSTPQPNPWTTDGFAFYAQHRFIYQAELAAKQGLLSSTEVNNVTYIANRLQDLVPNQPASILHGDLWSGNAISDSDGRPAIIDPAAYYGWAEADFAMTALFGRFDEAFYQAYTEVRPLEPGWQDRFKLYNLYHLLNHLNLFGRGYYGQVIQVVKSYR